MHFPVAMVFPKHRNTKRPKGSKSLKHSKATGSFTIISTVAIVFAGILLNFPNTTDCDCVLVLVVVDDESKLLLRTTLIIFNI